MTTILAIDDKPDNLLVLKALLKTFLPEATLVTALSGAEGIKKAQQESPDTIVLDVKMPIMDGYEVCRNLKADLATRHIPIVMLTAVHTDSKSKAKGLEAGADAFLTKPIDEIEFVAQIKAMLRIKVTEDLLRSEKDVLEKEVAKRTRELQCLYNILNITDNPQSSLDDNVRRIVEMIPSAWQYPDSVSAQIELEGEEYRTENFQPVVLTQSCNILLSEKQIGRIDVYCPIENRDLNENNSKHKEEYFLHEIAEQIRKLVERDRAFEENERLKNQLQQAQKMEAIGTLAGGIAHDFNNILSSIIGFTELSMDAYPSDERLQDDLREVYNAALRARSLVGQILAFSRKQEIVLFPLYVPPLIKEAIKLLRSSLSASIELEVRIDESVGKVKADPTKIHQVIMNICTNALHAMEEQGGVLTVEVKEIIPSAQIYYQFPELRKGPHLQMSFQDSGIGISPDILDSIYEPYFTTKNKGDGTGLGLATTYGIVQELHGAILVDSTVNQGSLFTVLLPITTEEIEGVKFSSNIVGQPAKGSEHILLVDDELPILKLTKRLLEKSGFKVTAESNGQAALETFMENPDNFDLLISDVSMPKLTGDILAQKVLAVRPHFPILLASGYSKNVSDESIVKVGARGLIQKPVTKEQLLKKIQLALSDKK